MKKIVYNDNSISISVQKRDLACLTDYDGPMPASIFMKICMPGAIFIDCTNVDEFVNFSDISEIEFFMDADWILDYDVYNAKSAEELHAFAEKMIKEINDLTLEYNKMSAVEQSNNGRMIEQMNLLIHEIQSIVPLIMAKTGKTVKLTPLIPIKNKASKIRQKQIDEERGRLILAEIASTFKSLIPRPIRKKLEKDKKSLTL